MGDEDRCSGLQMSCFRGAGCKVLLLGGLAGLGKWAPCCEARTRWGVAVHSCRLMAWVDTYRWHACEVTGRRNGVRSNAVRSEAGALAV